MTRKPRAAGAVKPVRCWALEDARQRLAYIYAPKTRRRDILWNPGLYVLIRVLVTPARRKP